MINPYSPHPQYSILLQTGLVSPPVPGTCLCYHFRNFLCFLILLELMSFFLYSYVDEPHPSEVSCKAVQFVIFFSLWFQIPENLLICSQFWFIIGLDIEFWVGKHFFQNYDGIVIVLQLPVLLRRPVLFWFFSLSSTF